MTTVLPVRLSIRCDRATATIRHFLFYLTIETNIHIYVRDLAKSLLCNLYGIVQRHEELVPRLNGLSQLHEVGNKRVREQLDDSLSLHTTHVYI